MPFPVPREWTLGSDDWALDEKKREFSPASFFWCQGRSLELAGKYFGDERLRKESRGGVARKHRHRITLSLFVQLMAAFEYMLKDFIATAIDITPLLDERLQDARWLELDLPRVLAQRMVKTGIGGVLLHPTMGWHKPDVVNQRYNELFDFAPIAKRELPVLTQLWLVRHSVAHNAGWVTGHDAFRLGAGQLGEKVVDVDLSYLQETFALLSPIVGRLASEVGSRLMRSWMDLCAADGPHWQRDQGTYERLKWLGTYTRSRVQSLPAVNEGQYHDDWTRHVG